MKVQLVSKDLSLYGVCREVLRSLPDWHWDFGRVPFWQPGIDADLWIWDCDAADEFPPKTWLREEHNILFVVDRQKVAVFRDRLLDESARILLKPVRSNLLQAFLEQMLSPAAPEEAEAGEPATSRTKYERDVLLQHLLEANQEPV